MTYLVVLASLGALLALPLFMQTVERRLDAKPSRLPERGPR